MNLSDRLRGIVGAPRASAERSHLSRMSPAGPPGELARDTLQQTLGGEWRHQGAIRCFVVDRRTPPDAMCGGVRVAEIAGVLTCAAAHAPLLTSAAPASPPFLFFDIETTGLSGGAGTYAFLVGCAWFCDDGAFLTRQYVLVNHHDERPMLESVAGELARAGTLVTFNGKSFDAPVLEMRYMFHRLQWPGARLPHLDVLHPARLFWGTASARLKADTTNPPREASADHRRLVRLRAKRYGETSTTLEERSRGGGGYPDAAAESTPRSCSLLALEQQILGANREGDVPGFEIPARYFQFLRNGDARPLGAVFEHNRLDLLSLAGLTARLLQLLHDGPGKAQDAHEALALGRVYQRGGLEDRAVEAFERTMAMSGSLHESQAAPVRVDALRSLACAARRARRHHDAAACWRQLLDVPLCPRNTAREALEALAIHHEHRVRDLGAARTFALGSLNAANRTSASARARHRLARLERKLSGAPHKRADQDAALPMSTWFSGSSPIISK